MRVSCKDHMETLTTLRSTWLIGVLAVNIFLVVAVYRSNPRSTTNKTYAFLGVIISLWLVAVFASLDSQFLNSSLALIRLAVSLAISMSMLFLLLAIVIPHDKLPIKRSTFLGIVFFSVFCMIVAISPYTFTNVEVIGGSPYPAPGPGIVLFSLVTTTYSFLSVVILLKKLRRLEGVERQQILFTVVGIGGMLGLIILGILIPVVFFKVNIGVSFAPLYTLIFLSMTAYAIVKHHLFNLKVIAAEALTIVIWISLLSRLAVYKSLADTIIDSLTLIITVVFGILLIKSVRKEVELREQLQKFSEELKVKNVQLDELSHFKTQLLSIASHQVKSPLAAMKGYVELVLGNTGGAYGEISDKTRETLQKVRRSADDLVGLINTLLDVRKVEEGKMDYQFAPTDAVELVSGIFEGLKPLAGEHKLEFTLSAPAEKIMIQADATKLKQVIQNIIDNAIKYTPAPSTDSGQAGRVNVAVEKKEGVVRVSVKDSGLGIPADLLPHLFEEFVRDEKVKEKILGTGLGLYIARRIVEAHGGKLWAESAGEGKGSTFSVMLPMI